MEIYKNMQKEATQWGNVDIDLYYQFIQSKNSTGYTICPVYSNEGDDDYYSRFDVIQYKRDAKNKYKLTPQLIEIKGRRDYSYQQFNSARVDLSKIEELQKFGKENNMDVFIVNIWQKDNYTITIHQIDLNKKYEGKWVMANIQTADTNGKINKVWKKMVDLPFAESKIYPYWYVNLQNNLS